MADLEIAGRHALLFDDDATAAVVNSGQSLVPWAADPSLLLDRHDVRHLLDRLPPRPRRSAGASAVDGDGVSVADLDRERFLDLPLGGDGDGDVGDAVPLDAGNEKSSDAGQGVYRAVPFAYGNADGSVDSKPSDSLYHPPFLVPQSLLNNLPPSEKLHQIIARTALFVSEHGGQSEIVLRVKQGDNPTFGFLMPDHHLHGYFRYLVDHPQFLKAGTGYAENDKDLKLGNSGTEGGGTTGGALSLLGAVYGSGEDDEGVLTVSSNSMDAGDENVTSAKTFSGQEEEGSTAPLLEDEEVRKHPTVTSAAASPAVTEKPVIKKKNQMLSGTTIVAAPREKIKDGVAALRTCADKLQRSQLSVSEAKQVILEPPSFLKRMMEKIVEFILRNGKEFEAKLIEQDKAIGRFPFLLSSNQYNPYYLKILQEAHESKLHGKSSSDHKDGARGNEGSKRRARAITSKDSTTSDRSSAEPSERHLYDHQKTVKFKMVIGGPKKEANQQTASYGHGGVSADEAAAIVLAATRGLSPANAPQNASKETSGSARGLGDDGRASSFGSFSSLHGVGALSKPASNSEAGTSLATDGQPNKEGTGTIDDVWIAKTIAKTAALAASREADSSEASLTREQKLKAERLRRAKMFAAIIKSGGNHITDLVTATNPPKEPVGASPADLTPSGTDSDPSHKEREGSSVPFDNERSYGAKQDKDSDDDHRRERKYRKKQHSESDDEDPEDPEESSKHSRKRHRSEHSRGHSKDGHKHRHKSRHRHSSKDRESRHRHRHHSSSEDEHRHRSSRSRHQHRDHDHHSEDEEQGRSHRHQKDHQSSSKRKRDIDVDHGESTLGHSEASLGSSDYQREAEKPPPTNAAQSSDVTTEVPNELRAKIRAMLLETL